MSATAVRAIASREAESTVRSSAKRLRVNEPGDSFEREADHVADTVSAGGRITGWSLSTSKAGQIQRDPAAADQSTAPKPNNYGDVLGKIAEAFMKTPTGKEILKYFTDQPVTKAVVDFIETPEGIAISGSAAVGAVSALAVAHKALPKQIPAIPLSFLKPGLKLKIDYEGPVNHPTQATLSISYEDTASKKKGGQIEKERFRAETASMAADQARFRAGLAPHALGAVVSPEAQQQRAEEKMVEQYELNRMSAFLRPGEAAKPGQYTPLVPGTQPLSLHMRNDIPSAQSATPGAASVAAPEAAKKEEIPVQRKAETVADFDQEASPEVESVLSSTGHSLDRETRRTMESRIGFDFSKVRIHSDSRAAASAKALGARAYTVGNNVVFGPGRYAPNSTEGLRLLAHELTHVVQQAPGSTLRPAGIAPAPVQIQRDLEEDSKDFSITGFVAHPRESLKNLARKIPGYKLFTVIIGRDPIAGTEVTRDATTLVGEFLKLVGAQETFKNLQESGALDDAFNWLKDEVNKLEFSIKYFEDLIASAIESVHPGDVFDIKGALSRIYEIFKPPLIKVKDFASHVLHKVLEFVFEGALKLVGGTGVLEILHGAGEAFAAVIKNPGAFLGHLGEALMRGFTQFSDKIGEYLEQGVMDWLFGEIGKVKIPKSITPGSVFNLILQVLGLTYINFRKRLVKALDSEDAVTYLEGAFEILSTMVTKGLGAAWELILQKAGNLLDTVLGAVKDWAITKVVTAAVAQLVLLFNPAGAALKAIQLVYETLKVFIDKAAQIAKLIKAISQSIAKIAAGDVASAANFIEQVMAKSIPMMISFLAGFLNLGDVGQKVREIIHSLKEKINSGIDKVLNYVVEQGKKLWAKGKETAGKILDWWRRRKEVTEGAEQHTIYLAGSEDQTTLMVASFPALTWMQFLDEKIKTAMPAQKASIEEIKLKAIELQKRLPPSKTDDEKAKNIEAKRQLFEEVSGKIAALGLHHDATDPASIIDFAPVRAEDDGGVGANASVLSSNFTPGKPPSDKPKIWSALGGLIGAKNYKRGHLLNENLGGPGLRFNLTPITTKANADHLAKIESTVKKAVLIDKKVMSYKVDVEYGTHPTKPKRMLELEQLKAAKKIKDGGLEAKELSELEAEQKLCTTLNYEAHELEHNGTQWVPKKGSTAVFKGDVANTLEV